MSVEEQIDKKLPKLEYKTSLELKYIHEHPNIKFIVDLAPKATERGITYRVAVAYYVGKEVRDAIIPSNI